LQAQLEWGASESDGAVRNCGQEHHRQSAEESACTACLLCFFATTAVTIATYSPLRHRASL